MKTTVIHTVRCSGERTMNNLKREFPEPYTSILVVEKESQIPLWLRKRSIDNTHPDFTTGLWKKEPYILRGVYYKTSSFYGASRVWFDYITIKDLITALDRAAAALGIKKSAIAYKRIKFAFENKQTTIRTMSTYGSGQYTSYRDHTTEVRALLDALINERIISGYEIKNDAPKGGAYGKFIDFKY